MSHTEHVKGKLTPTGKTISQFMRGKKPPSYYSLPEDLEEWFDDDNYRSAVCINGEVYTIDSIEIDSDGDIASASSNDDGTIDFELRFYNGGCSFSEAMDEAIVKLQAKTKVESQSISASTKANHLRVKELEEENKALKLKIDELENEAEQAGYEYLEMQERMNLD